MLNIKFLCKVKLTNMTLTISKVKENFKKQKQFFIKPFSFLFDDKTIAEKILFKRSRLKGLITFSNEKKR